VVQISTADGRSHRGRETNTETERLRARTVVVVELSLAAERFSMTRLTDCAMASPAAHKIPDVTICVRTGCWSKRDWYHAHAPRIPVAHPAIAASLTSPRQHNKTKQINKQKHTSTHTHTHTYTPTNARTDKTHASKWMKELNLNERQSEQLFNKGVCRHTSALPFILKKKENYGNSNISTC
jgi:hypothetical protein